MGLQVREIFLIFKNRNLNLLFSEGSIENKASCATSTRMLVVQISTVMSIEGD